MRKSVSRLPRQASSPSVGPSAAEAGAPESAPESAIEGLSALPVAQSVTFVAPLGLGSDPARHTMIAIGVAQVRAGVIQHSGQINVRTTHLSANPERMMDLIEQGIDLVALRRHSLSPGQALSQLYRELQWSHRAKPALGMHRVGRDLEFLKQIGFEPKRSAGSGVIDLGNLGDALWLSGALSQAPHTLRELHHATTGQALRHPASAEHRAVACAEIWLAVQRHLTAFAPSVAGDSVPAGLNPQLAEPRPEGAEGPGEHDAREIN